MPTIDPYSNLMTESRHVRSVDYRLEYVDLAEANTLFGKPCALLLLRSISVTPVQSVQLEAAIVDLAVDMNKTCKIYDDRHIVLGSIQR